MSELVIPESIDGVPYFSQKDPRWAEQLYTAADNAEQTMGRSGCVPTTQAMIDRHFSPDKNRSPLDFATWNIEHGFRTFDDGTDSLRSMPSFGDAFHYTVRPEILSLRSLKETFQRAGLVYAVVISNDRSTLGTPGGHAVVIRSLSEDESRIYVSTADSIEKSRKPWDLNKVINMSDPLRTFAVFDGKNR